MPPNAPGQNQVCLTEHLYVYVPYSRCCHGASDPPTPPPTPTPTPTPLHTVKGHKDMPVKVLWEIILQASVELMKYVCTKDAKTPKCKLFLPSDGPFLS